MIDDDEGVNDDDAADRGGDGDLAVFDDPLKFLVVLLLLIGLGRG